MGYRHCDGIRATTDSKLAFPALCGAEFVGMGATFPAIEQRKGHRRTILSWARMDRRRAVAPAESHSCMVLSSALYDICCRDALARRSNASGLARTSAQRSGWVYCIVRR